MSDNKYLDLVDLLILLLQKTKHFMVLVEVVVDQVHIFTLNLKLLILTLVP